MIRAHCLDRHFAQNLPDSVRRLYLDCYEQMLEEDRWDRVLDQEPD
jgi:hypothetical protein